MKTAVIKNSRPNNKSTKNNFKELSSPFQLYGEAFITIDDRQSILFFDLEAEKIFGHKSNEMARKRLDYAIPPSSNPILYQGIQLIQSGDLKEIPDRLNLAMIGLDKNGIEFPATISIFRVGTQDCQLLLLALRWVAESNPLEDKLRKFSRVIEQTSAMVVITDTNGCIEYINSAFEKVTGFFIEDALRKNPRILKSGLTRPETYQEMWKTILAGQVWHGELCNKKKNGDFYWASGTVSPVMDASGKTSNYISVQDDMNFPRKNGLQVKETI